MITKLETEAILLLQELISIPSISREEERTAQTLEEHLLSRGVPVKRLINNVWAVNKYFDEAKPTILLNSHHDTVKPNSRYTRDPFEPVIEDGKLYGLGSNDAGGALVCLLSCFLYFYEAQDLRFNLLFAASAEEEISGANGIEKLIPELPGVSFAIVGEPTRLEIAVAERGLLVLDCVSRGLAAHTANGGGENAIYKALKDIEWFRSYSFPEKSEILGPVNMTVSIIQAGVQHNVVPDTCQFTVDVRTTDKYRNEQVLDIVKAHVSCEVKARSLRLNASAVSRDHPMVRAGALCGHQLFTSSTTSDQALMTFPSFKMGPGDTLRSHTADEFIFTEEIGQGIRAYIDLLKKYNTLI